jgi:hypothetical protein
VSKSKARSMRFDGAFSTERNTYHVNTVDNYRRSRRPGHDLHIVNPSARDSKHRNSQMIIFKDVNDEHLHHIEHLTPVTLPSHYGCGFNPATHSRHRQDRRNHLEKRQSAPPSCFNSVPQVLRMGVAADCTYTNRFGGPADTLIRIISNWNLASAVFESTFNIQLAITEVKIMQACGNINNEQLPWNVPCSQDFTINERLSAFSQWRASRSDSAGLWHLMTLCNTGPTVGIAWLKELCSSCKCSISNIS